MNGKSQSIISKVIPAAAVLFLLLLWQFICLAGLMPEYMLPSPMQVVRAFVADFPLLMSHTATTLVETFWGLLLGVCIGFFTAVLMDRFEFLYRAIYPLLIITQTVPTVAIAPLLVLWLGYELAPKIVLIVIATFFPITVGVLGGFRSVDPDALALLRSMGANRMQIFRYLKFPSCLGQFFSSLRISTAYSVVGAVISEWLGGFSGLGVYMTRVKKSFAFDKMFAVIFLISIVSLLLMALVGFVQRKCMPWEYGAKNTRKKEEKQL